MNEKVFEQNVDGKTYIYIKGPTVEDKSAFIACTECDANPYEICARLDGVCIEMNGVWKSKEE